MLLYVPASLQFYPHRRSCQLLDCNVLANKRRTIAPVFLHRFGNAQGVIKTSLARSVCRFKTRSDFFVDRHNRLSWQRTLFLLEIEGRWCLNPHQRRCELSVRMPTCGHSQPQPVHFVKSGTESRMPITRTFTPK
jgi:hypothetical protein